MSKFNHTIASEAFEVIILVFQSYCLTFTALFARMAQNLTYEKAEKKQHELNMNQASVLIFQIHRGLPLAKHAFSVAGARL